MMNTMFVCGDIVNCGNSDGIVCSPEMAQLILSADYAVCNFEAPVSGYGKPQPKSGEHICQRKETIGALKQQGFDLLLLANNHIMDFGAEALRATFYEAALQDMDTLGAGHNIEHAYRPLVKKINGSTLGLINAGEAQFGVLDYYERKEKAGYAWINHHRIDNTILELRQKCDFVIVFSHAGLENYPLPQREWRERYRHFCDLGADIVIGSHPHVPQGYEYYKNSIIFYSLGNFFFDSKEFIEDKSFAVWLEFKKNGSVSFKPVFHYKNSGSVQIAPSDKQIDLEHLNSLLNEKYLETHTEMSLKAYECIRRNLKKCLLPPPLNRTLTGTLRTMVSYLLGKGGKPDYRLLQLHLFRNEAYYYAAKDALESINSGFHRKKLNK